MGIVAALLGLTIFGSILSAVWIEDRQLAGQVLQSGLLGILPLIVIGVIAGIVAEGRR